MQQLLSRRIFGYVRVSSVSQATHGQSLVAQQEQIAGYVQMAFGQSASVKYFVESGESAWKRKSYERTEFRKLMAEVRHGDCIVSTRLDRVFRNVLDALKTAENLKKRGVALHLIDLMGDVTTNGISGLFFTILSALSAHESTLKSERISDVKRSMKERGVYSGGRREIGFDVVITDGKKVFVVNEDELKLLEYIKYFKDLKQGGKIQGHSVKTKYSLDYVMKQLSFKFGDKFRVSRSTLNRLLHDELCIENRLDRIYKILSTSNCVIS